MVPFEPPRIGKIVIVAMHEKEGLHPAVAYDENVPSPLCRYGHREVERVIVMELDGTLLSP
jgi:hypothetical protein